MARRRTKSLVRQVAPDAIYGSEIVTSFINTMMWDGKKSVVQGVFYDALDIIKEKTGQEGIEVFNKAMDIIRPNLEVKARRVGGATYQVPVEIYPRRKQSLAIRWLISAARKRPGRSMAQKLAAEFMDAVKETGGAFKKKDEVRRMAEANRAFSHYAW